MCTIPFGFPVDPDVYSRYSMSSASIGSGGHWAGAPCWKSLHQTSRPSVQGTSWFVRRATITVRTLGHSLIASSAFRFNSATAPRRYPPSAVMTTGDFASLIRSRSDSGEKPAKTTECGAPMRAQARMAMATSGIIGM